MHSKHVTEERKKNNNISPWSGLKGAPSHKKLIVYSDLA